MTQIASFDVFDTLISRRYVRPKDIFAQAAIDVAIHCPLPMSPEVYASERFQAEKRAARRCPPLAAIATELTSSTGLAQATVQRLIDRELELEAAGLWAIEKNVRLVEYARAIGQKVVYISDTYLSSEFLKEVLVRLGIAKESETVFVSCEHSASKKQGALFHRVAEILGVRCTDITHVGDNRRADFDSAQLAGVKARLLAEIHANKYESAIRRFADQFPVDSQQRLQLSRMGASLRRIRLQHEHGNDPRFDVGVSVAAPLLYFFVASLLEWADEERIESLYFLSRHGDVLLDIARIISRERGKGPELRYLNVSREVALLSSLAEQPDPKQLRDLLAARRPESLRAMLDGIAGGHGPLVSCFTATELAQPFTALDPDRIIAPFLHDSGLYTALLAHNQAQRDHFRSYLVQEGLARPGVRCALVDVGWRLTMHELIGRTLIDLDAAAPHGFYLGIDRVATDARTGAKHAYLWDARGTPPWVGLECVTRVIEAFCSAEQGRTVAYRPTENGIASVTSEADVALYRDWGLPILREGILVAAEELETLGLRHELRDWSKLLIVHLLAKFWNEPTREEAARWGQFPHQVDPFDPSRSIGLHLPSSLIDITRDVWRRGSWRGNSLNSWPAANEHSVPRQVRRALKALQKARWVLR